MKCKCVCALSSDSRCRWRPSCPLSVRITHLSLGFWEVQGAWCHRFEGPQGHSRAKALWEPAVRRRRNTELKLALRSLECWTLAFVTHHRLKTFHIEPFHHCATFKTFNNKNVSLFIHPHVVPNDWLCSVKCKTVNFNNALKACTHRDEYRRALFASVFQCVFCVHTQAIFADDEPSEHANSFPDIRWRLM